MHRINGPGATAARKFTEGDPEQGIPPTEVGALWLNAVQEELAYLVEQAGLTLSEANTTQVEAAVRALMGTRNHNLLDNGPLHVWQRGFSRNFTSGSPDGDHRYYAADRWLVAHDVADDSTQQRVGHGVGSPVPSSDYFLRLEFTGAGTLTGLCVLVQRLEKVTTLQGQYAAPQFWARCETGSFSLTPEIKQHFGTGGSPSADVSTFFDPVTVTTSWQLFKPAAKLVPSTAGKVLGTNGDDHLQFRLSIPSGTAKMWFDFDQLQLQEGPLAGDFQLSTFAEELLRCQRFFVSTYEHGTTPKTTGNVPGVVGGRLFVQSSEPFSGGIIFWPLDTAFPVPMRIPPTVRWYNPSSGGLNIIDVASIETTPVAGDFTPDGLFPPTQGARRTGAPVLSGAFNAGNKNKYNEVWAHFTAEAEFVQ